MCVRVCVCVLIFFNFLIKIYFCEWTTCLYLTLIVLKTNTVAWVSQMRRLGLCKTTVSTTTLCIVLCIFFNLRPSYMHVFIEF
jgi:uncharacterized protein YqgC (DUF456 family)